MRSMQRSVLLACASLWMACSEAQTPDVTFTDAGGGTADNGNPGGSTDAGNPARDAGPVATDGGSRDAGFTDATTPTGDAPPGLVINEMRASGEDWIELYNAGTSPITLDGLVVADSESDGGGPHVSGAPSFPSGTVLAPGAYITVVGGHTDGGTGPQPCAMGGPTTCLHATWSISASRGEDMYVLGPDGGPVLVQAHYPMNGAGSGQSYGRLPNGSGDFSPNRPTPGAANQGP